MYLLYEAGACLAYGILGTALMALGYLVIDLLTPGRLHELVWEQRNRNATLLLSANTLGVAIVVAVAILASPDDLLWGLLATLVYGVIGLALMALSFLVIDLLTPGRLGAVIAEKEPHPAVWVNASAHIAVAVTVAAAIS
ncbi:DUF350 domain-containing protein [Marinactinospora rubrisoli]|uniref:DUF350 domain-containing protein n=1 Tax=Marinactinospora rubrisoli TaxID=2715399 RepID=A0ABW2KG31_9ACTN